MSKNCIKIVFFLLFFASKASAEGIIVNPSLFYWQNKDSDSIDNTSVSDTDTENKHIFTSIGISYLFDFGLTIGFKRIEWEKKTISETDNNGTKTKYTLNTKLSGIAASVGYYHKVGFYFAVNYFPNAEIKVKYSSSGHSRDSKYDTDGFSIDLGFMMGTDRFKIGPQLFYMDRSMDKYIIESRNSSTSYEGKFSHTDIMTAIGMQIMLR